MSGLWPEVLKYLNLVQNHSLPTPPDDFMQVMGTFANGRIEEFLVCKTLEPEEMADPLYVP